MKLGALHWKRVVLATDPPGKSLEVVFTVTLPVPVLVLASVTWFGSRFLLITESVLSSPLSPDLNTLPLVLSTPEVTDLTHCS